MSQNDSKLASLPAMTLKDIPEPKVDAQQITALVKEGGRITGYQLSDGRVLGKKEGIQLARQGGIRGVGIATRNGTEYLKSLPDGSEANNLGNLPSIMP